MAELSAMESINPSQAGQYTPEYLALRKSYRNVLAHITPQTGDVCGALFEKGYIPPNVRTYATTDAIPNDRKAQALLDTVIDKVEVDPSVYHGFMDILKSEGPSADTIVEQLEEAFKAEQACAVCDNSSEDSSHSLPESSRTNVPKPKPEATARFICPFCGKCTVVQFFSKAGCPKATQQGSFKRHSLFPFLNHSALSRNEQLMLESQLLDETKKIVGMFASFEMSIIASLESKNVSVSKLKAFAGNYVRLLGSKEDVESLKKSENLYDIFFALQPFKSFFNYEIVESIIKQFGSDEDRQLMGEYYSQFNKFCERSVFEVPPNIFHDADPKPGDKMFSVKLTKEGYALLGDVVAMRKKLADILNIEVVALQLCCITEGCICIRFLISACVAGKIFPLMQAQYCALSDIDVIIQESPSPVERGTCKTWTLDSGLDHGLDSGL